MNRRARRRALPGLHAPVLPLIAALIATVVAAALAPSLAAAQAGPALALDSLPERSRFSATAALLNTQPLGTLDTGPGIGLAVAAAWALDPAHRIRLQAEMRGAGYGSERRRACLSETVGCLIQLDVTTSYTTFYFGVGPELALPLFGAELILEGTAGLGSFAVTSSVEGVSDPEEENLFSTTNFQDDFFAWSAGGELRIPVGRTISISLGTHYQHNGQASYVPEGGISLNPDGSLDIAALTGDANLVAITLGLAFRPHVGWTDDLAQEDQDDREPIR